MQLFHYSVAHCILQRYNHVNVVMFAKQTLLTLLCSAEGWTGMSYNSRTTPTTSYGMNIACFETSTEIYQ